MSNPIKIEASIALPSDFEFSEVSPKPGPKAAPTPVPSLGPLSAFTGKFVGTGFNTIFRPDFSATPLPINPGGSDNILELNLTTESLVFSPSLGAVPNRGTSPQQDIFLNGVPYLQTVSDVTTPGQTTGIHVEPGLWMIVPSTTNPDIEQSTLVRMASIPHGTTICAQGTFSPFTGPPSFDPVDITPFAIGNPGAPHRFASQTATNQETPRIPQDLSTFIAAQTITQDMLNNPNVVLENAIKNQTITGGTVIKITAERAITLPSLPTVPTFGGGTDNIAFLVGDANVPPTKPNADAIQMTAVFWIETVEHSLHIPIIKPWQGPVLIKSPHTAPGHHPTVFSVTPPVEMREPVVIRVSSTQIQYSQIVFLNFAGLTWPHVSVATLVPGSPIVVPSSAWL